MKWFARVGLTVLAIVAIFAGVGIFLPSDFKVVRSIEINQPASKVYPLVADFKQWRSWGVWYKRDPEMTTNYSGTSFQKGHKVTWVSLTEGSGEMTLIDTAQYQSVTYSLFFPDFDMKSTGHLHLDEKDGKTIVEWSDTGDVGNDILSRYFVLFIDDMIGPDFEAGLENLKKLAEQ